MRPSSSLLDALSISHGPRARLDRYFQSANRVFADLDLSLKVHPLSALYPVYDAHEDTFHGLPPFFDTRLIADDPDASACFIGYDQSGSAVTTFAVKNIDLRGLSLATEISSLRLFAGFADQAKVPPIAAEIYGHALYCGAYWVRPDWRGKGLGDLLPALASYYGLGHWPVDFRITFGAASSWHAPDVARHYQFEAAQKGFTLTNKNKVVFDGYLAWGRAQYALDQLDARTFRLGRRDLARIASPSLTAPAP